MQFCFQFGELFPDNNGLDPIGLYIVSGLFIREVIYSCCSVVLFIALRIWRCNSGMVSSMNQGLIFSQY